MRNSRTADSSADTSQRIVLSEQSIGLASVPNARELGGYKNTDGLRIKRGRLIRSGQLTNVTKQDATRLVTEYKLGMVIDLRSKREAEELPDPMLFAVKYYNFPVTDDRENDLPAYTCISDAETYYSMLYRQTAISAYRQFFDCLLSAADDKAVLFHSAYGKDRAGIAAALLLTLLDIPEETVTEDHLLTNKANAHTVRLGDESVTVPAYSDGVQLPENVYAHSLEYALARVVVEYGSVREYIKEIARLSENDIKELKRKFLE